MSAQRPQRRYRRKRYMSPEYLSQNELKPQPKRTSSSTHYLPPRCTRQQTLTQIDFVTLLKPDDEFEDDDNFSIIFQSDKEESSQQAKRRKTTGTPDKFQSQSDQELPGDEVNSKSEVIAHSHKDKARLMVQRQITPRRIKIEIPSSN